jgi:CRISPR system Cascade subunit CasC
MIIALHMLQNHAPSNLNRDDSGNPKSCLFGGTNRARISSQAIKRSIRTSEIFRSYFADAPDLLGIRTREIPAEINDRLENDYADRIDASARNAIREITRKIGTSGGKNGNTEKDTKESKKAPKKAPKKATMTTLFETEETETETEESTDNDTKRPLLFMSGRELDQLTSDIVHAWEKGGADAVSTLCMQNTPIEYQHTVDIAMFGRMSTSKLFKPIEAAVQVAHAISTHDMTQEFDYFTAVDDRNPNQAGHIGDIAFNSATYYKYINVHWDELLSNLHHDTAIAMRSVRALIHAAVLVTPSGKQNTFSAHNPPDVVLVEVRPQNVPVSYANAVVDAVGSSSIVQTSASQLQSYIAAMDAMYAMPCSRAYITSVPFSIPGATNAQSLPSLLDWLVETITE